MNPATAQAQVMVDELVRDGVRHVVLSPGSRNAALAFALQRAEVAGRVRLHVRVDERSAGYLALGLAAGGTPVAVVCTSGTAAANLHPVVSEARHAGVPLVLLTADRPPELRAAGANQSIDQNRLYTSAVRWFDEIAVAENRPGQNAYWRSQVCRAVHTAAGGGRQSAPVHLNVPFREPLVPDEDGGAEWCESLEGRADGGPWTGFGAAAAASAVAEVRSARGLVLLADRDAAERAAAWARELGWPLLSETGGVVAGENALSTGMWLLALPEFVRQHRPEQVVCVGRPTVFRQVQRLLADSGVEVILVHSDPDGWPAPAHDVSVVADGLDTTAVIPDPEWLDSWRAADHEARTELSAALEREEGDSGPVVAGRLVEELPADSLLVLGSSNPARDVALCGVRRPDVRVHRNRGAAGIDGLVSTAVGVALESSGPNYALLGDLGFLHDSNGLLLGPHERRPDLTIVVYNDDGGGIFSLLEQGRSARSATFERVFGTPHGTDLAALCAAHHVPHELVTGREELASALRYRPGLRVVEVRAPREGLRGVHDRLHEAVSAAVLG
ncbi:MULTISPECIES: 2-succinyl-5-enolpyruvyl-6-hydroxy-3-cyclohexene-1-carboxylic-acid synthase [unclassified Actinopolyspora]|uniref:2-succinyl-5-enolpyruvyl-6-hydroxy-3- cyclohexene-1-carboxylic-acid synthase n=1 Tax=unclassified Actinopolyspora TaxID=2639451 RepID=UPI0013F6215B|nr:MULTISPECIES: 2-succinyl-5-enolpyruvyl-6-hydroxy-3-cyclohexene-1-carboxylic-acid synthase [unclassified Actinopolyspora]NHD16511.1 2-succinyl-5-enolpyruvyl-6-hydroxy-3-cyclohexene-1-carboxylic-acid synthase [Actinopolyspora sp. BKK2]NHE75626.1 2-succinyl-5-enolpyruvyl-6-hydroxy-3-cyclohexene-1-carboxylic-acid synthase [Actinopolyspora sp. BKK1]